MSDDPPVVCEGCGFECCQCSDDPIVVTLPDTDRGITVRNPHGKTTIVRPSATQAIRTEGLPPGAEYITIPESQVPERTIRIVDDNGQEVMRLGSARERWNAGAGKQLPSDPRVEAFLDEIEHVCRKHGMTISHEDQHGGFQIHGFETYNINWLRSASDNRVIPRDRPLPRACPNRFQVDHRRGLSYPPLKDGKCTTCGADTVAVDIPESR